MERSRMRLLTCLLLAFALCLPIFFAVGCSTGETNDTEGGNTTEQTDGGNTTKPTDDTVSIGKFYDAVVESQTRLNNVADTIYNYWYDAIYEDEYSGSIDLAIAFAMSDCKEDINFIKTNETSIQSLYKIVRDSELKSEVKEVMTAYSDYYEFVINVSGSFKTYSENKETYKKALATALKHLFMEL